MNRKPSASGDISDWFLVKVLMLCRETGERRWIHHWSPVWKDGSDWSDFMWSEGNYSCDCNRRNFFNDVGAGLEDNECGEGGFIVEKIIDTRTGELLYSEKP